MIVECPACGRENRLPDEPPVGIGYRCDRCAAGLAPTWRDEPPTESQATRVWQLDQNINRQFADSQAYFRYCRERYDAGDRAYKSGAMSARNDRLIEPAPDVNARRMGLAKSGSDASGCGSLGWVAVLGCIVWVTIVLYSQNTKASADGLAKTGPARDAVAAQFAATMPSAEVRLEQLGGFNLKVWISQQDFDSVPYPDRKVFVEGVGGLWCRAVDYALFPSVTIRDIRSGKELASYSCVFSHASLD